MTRAGRPPRADASLKTADWITATRGRPGQVWSRVATEAANVTNFRDDASRPRLLIVEGDELIAALLAEAVEQALDGTYEVSHTGTAAGARHLLFADGADALLLDYRLPDGTASPVLREADRLGVPVLVISGEPGAVAELAHRGRAVLAKPFGAAEWRDALRHLPRASARRGVSRGLGPGTPPDARPVRTRLGRLAARSIAAARRGVAWGASSTPAPREHLAGIIAAAFSAGILASAAITAMALPLLRVLLRRRGPVRVEGAQTTPSPTSE